MAAAYALFETAIGDAAIAWGPHGLVRALVPDVERERTRRTLLAEFPDAIESEPPPAIARAIRAIVDLLAGERVDLSFVAIDYGRVSPFHRAIYEALRRVPPGETCTYGELAARAGSPGAARAVGRAMATNPFPIVVPCHRVLGASGKLVGFSAPGGTATKQRMLAIESRELTLFR